MGKRTQSFLRKAAGLAIPCTFLLAAPLAKATTECKDACGGDGECEWRCECFDGCRTQWDDCFGPVEQAWRDCIGDNPSEDTKGRCFGQWMDAANDCYEQGAACELACEDC